MKRFDEFIEESLHGALVEPKSKSAAEAKKLKLKYAGFGRYEDEKTKQVTHIVQNDRLVPFNKAVKSNTYKQQSGDDIGDYVRNLKPEIDAHHNELSSKYIPDKYKPNELQAIADFTNQGYATVNGVLSGLPAGIPAQQIQPQGPDDTTPQTIADLDNAVNRVKSPKDFIAYVGLGQSVDPSQLTPGQSFAFKGFRSVSLNPNIIINSGQTTILQIRVTKGSKGMYTDDFSSTPGESEYLLPRGAACQIISGPHRMLGSNAYTGDQQAEIIYFDCALVKQG